MQEQSGAVAYSPSDLIRYFASPFASWMDRYHLENPDGITPDEETARLRKRVRRDALLTTAAEPVRFDYPQAERPS
jgi:hypothetical protein